jgi:hemolysin activation/secretion protein
MAAPIHRVLPSLSLGYWFMTGLLAPSAIAQVEPIPPTAIPLQANPSQVNPAATELKLLPTGTAAKGSESLEVLPPPDLQDTPNVQQDQTKVKVNRFEVVGSTRFKPEEFAKATAPYSGRELTFAEMVQARSAVTKLYVDKGYVTTGALILPQTMDTGIVTIQVVEGTLEDVVVTGNKRLNGGYIRDRIRKNAGTPLNVDQLLTNLQMLRLDPRIKNLSADLQAGVRPGTNRLAIDIQEADTFSLSSSFDNGRSPSVGSFRRKLELREGNLLGFGDAITLGYSNTKGSNSLDLNYTLPLNSRNGSVWLSYGSSRNNVIEEPFTVLDIQSKARYFEFGLRQPLMQKPTEEFAMGFVFSRQSSQTELGIDNIGPFPLSPGADSDGRTRVSALRFFQEYTKRSEKHVFALRSQFSLGLNWFGANISDDEPDSRFAAWRGQGQWVRQFAKDSLFLIKGDVQFANDTLLPLEQMGIGGQVSVRGYRQDALLTDAGALLSAEMRLPLIRTKRGGGVLQVAPFLDFGTAWNIGSANPSPNTLASAGLGLIWKQGENFSVRLDWGIPLRKLEGEKRSLQERGIYFSVNYAPF